MGDADVCMALWMILFAIVAHQSVAWAVKYKKLSQCCGEDRGASSADPCSYLIKLMAHALLSHCMCLLYKLPML
jgi:hypothetical protein